MIGVFSIIKRFFPIPFFWYKSMDLQSGVKLADILQRSKKSWINDDGGII